jgi:hypothetical protein
MLAEISGEVWNAAAISGNARINRIIKVGKSTWFGEVTEITALGGHRINKSSSRIERDCRL